MLSRELSSVATVDLCWVLPLVTSNKTQAGVHEVVVVIPEKERTRTAFLTTPLCMRHNHRMQTQIHSKYKIT